MLTNTPSATGISLPVTHSDDDYLGLNVSVDFTHVSFSRCREHYPLQDKFLFEVELTDDERHHFLEKEAGPYDAYALTYTERDHFIGKALAGDYGKKAKSLCQF